MIRRLWRALCSGFDGAVLQWRMDTVAVKYPNWEATVRCPQFRLWEMSQPPEIQALVRSRKPGDAIRMLDLYAKAVHK